MITMDTHLKNVSRNHQSSVSLQTKEGKKMTRTYSFLFLFLFLASCGKGGSGSSSITDAELSSEVVPVEAQTFDINAELSGFDRDQEEKIYKAFDLIKKVISTDEFKRKVLGKTYNGKKQFVDNGGMTNAEIYNRLLGGSELLTKGSNNTMDLHLKAYYEKANVIGYTMPSIKTIYVNTRYLNKNDFKENEVAMNLTHEWLHKLGFKHAQKRTESRPHSVPYAIGYIMRTLAGKIN
jgi:hypothetical protein